MKGINIITLKPTLRSILGSADTNNFIQAVKNKKASTALLRLFRGAYPIRTGVDGFADR